MTTTLQKKNTELYTRLATPEEYDQVIDVARDAFIHDPALLYFGNVKLEQVIERGLGDNKDVQLRKFIGLLMNATVLIKGRVVVVVRPSEDSAGGQEQIVSAALWLPPNQRIELYHIRLLLRSGVIGVLRSWGLTGLLRIAVEWMDTSYKLLVECFKTRGVKKSVNDSWYLLLVMTHPDHQDQGHLSRILKEAFANAPNDTYTLDATTAKSRDRYGHHGYEVLFSFKLGEGKVSAKGFPEEGSPAEGVEIFSMVKWAPSMAHS